MHRIFCNSQDITSDKIIISDAQQIHHLRDVLRLKIGDEISVCDDKGDVHNSVIEKLTAKNIVFKMKPPESAGSLRGIKITIACAIPKKSKFDDIVDKLTQLGVDRIIPMRTERVIVKLDSRKAALRLKRWSKISQSASEQSKRNTLPVVEPVKKFSDALSQSCDYDLKLIPALIGGRKALKQILGNARPKKIFVLIGPEGDFTEKEIKLAKAAGFIPVSLGDLVLRVETAAMAVASFIRLYANY